MPLSLAAMKRLDYLNDWITYQSHYQPSQVVFSVEAVRSRYGYTYSEVGCRIVAKANTGNGYARLYMDKDHDTITTIKHRWDKETRRDVKADPEPLRTAVQAHWASIASDEDCAAKRAAAQASTDAAKEQERQDARIDLDTLGTVIATAVQNNVGTTGIDKSYWRPVALAALKWAVACDPKGLKRMLMLLEEKTNG